MSGALRRIRDDDNGDDGDRNNLAHCDEYVEAVGGGKGEGSWLLASLCIYLQLPDGAQQKQRVFVFPVSSLPSLGLGFWTMFQVPAAGACSLGEWCEKSKK